jgi:hypothetical protein
MVTATMSPVNLAHFRLHSREEFQTWLALDLDVRDELYAFIGRELDVDVASLDELETFLLDRYPAPEAITALDQRGIADAAARHVGRVLILNVDDAVWEIDLDNADNVYYRLPITTFLGGEQECPLTMVLACLDRRTGNYLRTLVENYQEDYNSG